MYKWVKLNRGGSPTSAITPLAELIKEKLPLNVITLFLFVINSQHIEPVCCVNELMDVLLCIRIIHPLSHCFIIKHMPFTGFINKLQKVDSGSVSVPCIHSTVLKE